ncbi:Vacuolar protein sorting-associated protein 41-like [Vitis vinifera]|uniref:Vacuolar protein sorting-associated protein 41-like n=1 Tax=Vitis vinifera TaxID=29760 RepID=A0A438KG13_VITVI|nr:Vacuolar protein sorting-associated protein 41-like [Vitis vinifera]
MEMLRDRLVKIITDYRTETSLRHGCNDILKADCVNWTCTEMVMPIGHGNNDTMFQAWPFDLNNHTKTCEDLFGVTPRPHWITTEFGGHVSFCFFLFYSSTRYIRWRGSYMYRVYRQRYHCLDLSTPTATDSQQEKEVKIIGLWLAEYNAS